MEYLNILQKEQSKVNQSTHGKDLYLLDAQSAWVPQQMLSEDCLPMVKKYTLSTPLREVIVKIEPCQIVDISTHGKDLYLLDAQSAWLPQQVLSEDCLPMVKKYTLSTPLREVIVKIEPCQMVDISTAKSFLTSEETDDVPLSGIKKEEPIKRKTCKKQEEVIKIKTDIFCDKLSVLLGDGAGNSSLCEENNCLNEMEGYADKYTTKINNVCQVLSDQLNYECNICGRKFTQKDTLKAHLVVHTGLKKYECDQCGKKYAQYGSLKFHVATKHTGAKAYGCDQCGKLFSQSSHLKYHMVTHTGVKDYACDECGKKFGFSFNLKRHMVTHAGSKSYECDQCGKQFSQSTGLKYHMITHTGAKDYECYQCGKRFGFSFTLKRHMVTHTLL